MRKSGWPTYASIRRSKKPKKSLKNLKVLTMRNVTKALELPDNRRSQRALVKTMTALP